MKVDNSFAREHSSETATFGVASSAICRAIFICTISCVFSQARMCQLMLLNSIYCIQHSCPSAHMSDFVCLFHLWQANLRSFFKAGKIIQHSRERDILYLWLSFCVLQVSIFRFWYFRHTSWTSVVLFINLSSLKERECFQVFLILAYPVYSLFTFVLVAWYVITLLKYGQCSGHLKYMMYYHICGLKMCEYCPFCFLLIYLFYHPM